MSDPNIQKPTSGEESIEENVRGINAGQPRGLNAIISDDNIESGNLPEEYSDP